MHLQGLRSTSPTFQIWPMPLLPKYFSSHLNESSASSLPLQTNLPTKMSSAVLPARNPKPGCSLASRVVLRSSSHILNAGVDSPISNLSPSSKLASGFRPWTTVNVTCHALPALISGPFYNPDGTIMRPDGLHVLSCREIGKGGALVSHLRVISTSNSR